MNVNRQSTDSLQIQNFGNSSVFGAGGTPQQVPATVWTGQLEKNGSADYSIAINVEQGSGSGVTVKERRPCQFVTVAPTVPRLRARGTAGHNAMIHHRCAFSVLSVLVAACGPDLPDTAGGPLPLTIELPTETSAPVAESIGYMPLPGAEGQASARGVIRISAAPAAAGQLVELQASARRLDLFHDGALALRLVQTSTLDPYSLTIECEDIYGQQGSLTINVTP